MFVHSFRIKPYCPYPQTVVQILKNWKPKFKNHFLNKKRKTYSDVELSAGSLPQFDSRKFTTLLTILRVELGSDKSFSLSKISSKVSLWFFSNEYPVSFNAWQTHFILSGPPWMSLLSESMSNAPYKLSCGSWVYSSAIKSSTFCWFGLSASCFLHLRCRAALNSAQHCSICQHNRAPLYRKFGWFIACQ